MGVWAVRTVTPLVVGFVVTQAARLGVEIDEATTASFVTMVVSGVYAAVARVLEQRWPSLSVLLGSKRQPSYQPPD